MLAVWRAENGRPFRADNLRGAISPGPGRFSVVKFNRLPVIDISAESGFCRTVGAVFHCDAAQAPTGIPIDVEALGVDLMSLSSHKMYGPKGIGALFVSHSVRRRLRPILHGGGHEGGLRSGTLPTPLCVGFGEAARLLMARVSRDAETLSAARQPRGTARGGWTNSRLRQRT
jgi:cysteine desulfurase